MKTSLVIEVKGKVSSLRSRRRIYRNYMWSSSANKVNRLLSWM